MTEAAATEPLLPVSPGALLKAAREARELSERETADRLNWMPGYVDIIERDDYQALRSPAFARGYVKAYGRLVNVDEDILLGAFDELRSDRGANSNSRRVETRPLHLQRTGVGVVIGLATLLLLVLTLWWLQEGRAETVPLQPSALELQLPDTEQPDQGAGPAGQLSVGR